MSGRNLLSIAFKLSILGVATLFTVQNMSRTSGLSLDLWVVGIQLGDPQPVPYLLGTALALGLILGVGWGIQSRRNSSRRIRQLESDLVRLELGRSPDSASTDWT